MKLPPFRLEAYFSKWEFRARYNLAASDCEALTLAELLALAGEDERERWDRLQLGYTQTFGSPVLREAIAGTYETIGAEHILCFAGAQEALYLAMLALLGRGDHAVVVAPNYQSAETLPLVLCEVSGVALDPSNGWHFDVGAVERALRSNTKLVAVNFPNNPTGAMPGEETWRDLAALCASRGIRLFSDEVYRGLERAPNAALTQAADLLPSALSLNVMSKAYGLAGLRVGWIASKDRELLDALERLKHYTTICNAGPSEVLALIALRAREEILQRNRALVERNVALYEQFFSRHADLFEFRPPRGGSVAFVRYLGDDDVEAMCDELVGETGVLLLPASMFHSSVAATPADRFRIGLGRDDTRTRAALERWDAWLEA